MITKTSAICKKTISFVPKTTNSNSIKTVTSLQKLTCTIATTSVWDDEEVVIMTKDDKVSLTQDEI